VPTVLYNGPSLDRTRLRHRTDRPLTAAERDELAREWTPIAQHMAAKFHRTLDCCDPESAAVLALAAAVNSYDPQRGTPFATWLWPRLLGELKRDRREQMKQSRPLSRRRYEFLVQAERREKEREDQGLPPLPEAERLALAERMGVPHDPGPRKPQEMLSYNLEHRLAHQDNEKLTLGDHLACPLAPAAIQEVERSGFWAALARILDDRELLVLQCRYLEELTQAETAGRAGCSQMEVSRIERRAKAKLQWHGDTLSEFLG
jgi:RNA polymerase sigma-B factor